MTKIIADPETFFSRLAPARDTLLLALESEAAAKGIPIVGPVVGGLLEILVRATGARRILELGCATGYSAIFLARGCAHAGGNVLTVEMDPRMVGRARAHVAAAGLSCSVDVLQGEAQAVLIGLQGPFDFIFLDIDKGGYLPALAHCGRLLRPGGLLAADNTAFAEASDFAQAISASPLWRAVHLFSYLPGHAPEHDALTLALRAG